MSNDITPLTLGWTIVYVEDPVAASEFYAGTFGLTPEFVAPDGSYAQLDTGQTKLAFASYALAESNFPGGVAPARPRPAAERRDHARHARRRRRDAGGARRWLHVACRTGRQTARSARRLPARSVRHADRDRHPDVAHDGTTGLTRRDPGAATGLRRPPVRHRELGLRRLGAAVCRTWRASVAADVGRRGDRPAAGFVGLRSAGRAGAAHRRALRPRRGARRARRAARGDAPASSDARCRGAARRRPGCGARDGDRDQQQPRQRAAAPRPRRQHAPVRRDHLRRRGSDRGKPAPTLYLEALARLGLDAGEAIALEDSPNGVAAARGAGLYCIAVPSEITRGAPGLEAADRTIGSLAEVDPRELSSGRRFPIESAAMAEAWPGPGARRCTSR